MIPPATQWIKKNMMGDYSEELGRPLTDAEVRVKRSLEQLQVPDWYKKYSKPTKFLKSSVVAYDRRPPTWKTFKQKHASGNNTPKKTPRKCTPKKAQRKVVQVLIQPAQCAAPPSPIKPTICAVQTKPDYNNEKVRITRKATLKRKSPSISITPSSSDTECDTSSRIVNAKSPSADVRSPRSLNSSHTFPRVNASRKIQNINIVFDKPFPSKESLEPPPLPTSVPPQKTVYTLTKKIDLEASQDEPNNHPFNGSINNKHNNSHTSFLFAEVEPSGVVHQVQGFAGLDSSCDIEDNEMTPARCAPSPHTRFFNSSKKSSELEKIVQTGLSRSKDSGNRSLIQEIIEELDRSVAEGRSFLSSEDAQNSGADGFVKGMIQALEDSYRSTVIVEDDNCSDSELAKSTTISMYEDSGDEPASTLPGRSCCVSSTEEEEEDEEAFWIPVQKPTVDKAKRSSSRSSVLSSRNSSRSAKSRSSPVVSPIKEKLKRTSQQLYQQRYWSAAATYKRDSRAISRRLFKIDETGVADSGYTTNTNSSSSRTCTMSSDGGRSSTGASSSSEDASSRSSSQSTSPTHMMEYDAMSGAVFSRSSDAFVMKSILV